MTLGFIEWNGNLYTIKNIPACSPNKGCEVLQKFLENETDVTVELKKNLKYKNNKLKKNIKIIAAIDLLIENKLVIELKTVETFTDVHFAQILTYMKLGGYSTGLLINFNTKMLKQGLKRFKI